MTSETQTQARNEPATEAGRTLLYDPDEGYPVGLEDAMGRDATRWRDTLRDRILAIEAEARHAALREQTRITPIDVDVLACVLRDHRPDNRGSSRDCICYEWRWQGNENQYHSGWTRHIAAEYSRLAALPHDSTPGEEGDSEPLL